MPKKDHLGWYKHGKLPHLDAGGLYQFITYRLDDSLPKALKIQLEHELNALSLSRELMEIERRKRTERLLDAGHGSCILRQRENAQLVIDAWRYFDTKRYDLLAGVVMPNHVHLLARIYPGAHLGDVVEAWKSFTSRRFVVDPSLGYRPHWQRGYWDRYIRNEGHLRDTALHRQ